MKYVLYHISKAKYLLFFLLLLTPLSLLLSCEDDMERPGDSPEILLAGEITTNDGRLLFNSTDNLSSFIIKSKEEEDFEKYKQGLKLFENSKFRSLLPVSGKNEMQKSEEYLKFKQSDIARIRANNPSHEAARGSTEDDFDANEDIIVADSYFAALLNRKREIQVDDKVYRYTEYGILYTEVSNASNLESAHKELQSSDLLLQQCEIPYAMKSGVYFIQPSCGGGGTGGGSSGGGTTTPTKPDIGDLKLCDYDPNLWDDIFGPAQSCIDKFSKHRRIKTKAWSQNYIVFASVGIKVESQKRTLGIWWAHKIDELELGYERVYYEVNHPFGFADLNPIGAPDYAPYYLNKEYVIDYNGNVLHKYKNIYNDWFKYFPINNPDQNIIAIVIPNASAKSASGHDYYSISGKDANSWLKSMTKNAVKNVLKATGKELNKGGIVIISPNDNKDKTTFIFYNWSKNNLNDNKISSTFDWNTATFSISIKPSNNWKVTPDIKSGARSYKKFSVVCYGMGSDGSSLKGSRVMMNHEK